MGDPLDLDLPVNAEEFQTMLDKARAFDLTPIIRRYASENRVSLDRASAIGDEMLKYLTLCGINPQGNWTITGEVDEMWHTFILFTERYQEFCGTTTAGFIHHIPKEEIFPPGPGDPSPSAELFRKYSRTLSAYEKLTGNAADSSIWPSPSVFLRARDPQACEGGSCSGSKTCGCGPKGGGADPNNLP